MAVAQRKADVSDLSSWKRVHAQVVCCACVCLRVRVRAYEYVCVCARACVLVAIRAHTEPQYPRDDPCNATRTVSLETQGSK